MNKSKGRLSYPARPLPGEPLYVEEKSVMYLMARAGKQAGTPAIRTSSIRDVVAIKEETGLDFEPYTDYPDCLKRPFIQSQGMSDECDITVYGYASGTPSLEGNEATEDIEVIIAGKEEVKEILSEKLVTMRTYYLLMQFLKSDPGNPFEFLNI